MDQYVDSSGDEPAGPSFLSFAVLRWERGVSIGDLAAAVKVHGVIGWDRHGKEVHSRLADKDPAVAQLALDLLAGMHSRESVPGYRPSDAELDPPGNPLFNHGWWSDACPDFSDPGKPLAVSAGGSKKRENGLLRILGGVLMAMKGELGWPAHPSYVSEADLIKHMSAMLKGYPGCSTRNMQDAFRDAKRALDDT